MAITDLEPRLLVEAHNAGDDDAFALIVQTHHQSLFAHAITRLHDVQAAEDAVQETFVRAYRAMPRFQGDFHLRAWLHRILTNVCHDEGSRRQRAGRLFELASAQAVVEAEAADVDIDRLDVSREVVVAALASLPISYREALVLRYVEELSYEQVAEATGVTPGNARVRVMRGRAALKRALTSSHAIVIAVVPWLRRDGRGAAVDLPELATSASMSSLSSSAASVASAPAVLANTPALLRAIDTAPLVAERAASIPQIIGMVAAMAMPIAAPVVSNQVTSWTRAPATSAAPADAEVSAAAPRDGVTGAVPTETARSSTITTLAAPRAVLGDASTATVDSVDETTPQETTSEVTTVGDSSTSPATSPSTAPTTTAAPPADDGADTDPVIAAPIEFTARLWGRQITSVGDPRTDLAGTVRWGQGSSEVGGQLAGTIVFDRAVAEGAPPAKGADPAAEDGAEPTADGSTADPGAPVARTFTGELTLALDDGQRYVLRLSDGTLDHPDTGTAVTAGFELLDACGSVVATGSITGDLDLREAPVPSSLDLAFSGEGPVEVPACG